MKNKNGKVSIISILVIIILLFILVKAYGYYKTNFFNDFERATFREESVTFRRDSSEKYSKYNSYEIINSNYNDSAIVKEIKVEPNTPYRVTCMVKTEDVVCEDVSKDGGVSIGLMDTTEYSKAIVGSNDWQKMEFIFDSKNRETVKISFRIGGNSNNCKGKVWFSDFKIEKGIKKTNNEWNVGCFVIKQVDVTIDGKEYNFRANKEDLRNVELNMERFKDYCYENSNKQMTVNYEIIEIEEPLTKISYSEDQGYYFEYTDTEDIIYDIVKEKNFEHIFIVCRMEDEGGTTAIPIEGNWIGLGGMDMYGVGYSIIRLNKNANTYSYRYGITNQLPEEVYVHEFLHTLERNEKEYGYTVPALHDYERYGYTEVSLDGLNKWYQDYMSKSVLDKTNNTYIGLDSFVYNTQPVTNTCFKYPIEIKFIEEPENIISEIIRAFEEALKK